MIITSNSGGGSGSGGKVTNGFRLTLTTATPVTTSDVTAATTIYLTPYLSNEIAIYGGASWAIYTSAEVSIALGTLTSGKNYDIFAYWTGSALALEFSAAWTSDTARSDAVVMQDGVLVKSADHTRRYVGTFRTTATTTTEDSLAKRFLFNQSNRVRRPMKRVEATASWSYAVANTWRQANASASNQVEYVTGDAGTELDADLTVPVTGTSNTESVGIGIDSTTAVSGSQAFVDGFANGVSARARYRDFPGLGYHKVCWLEAANTTGGATFYGTNSARNAVSALHASVSG